MIEVLKGIVIGDCTCRSQPGGPGKQGPADMCIYTHIYTPLCGVIGGPGRVGQAITPHVWRDLLVYHATLSESMHINAEIFNCPAPQIQCVVSDYTAVRCQT